MVEHHCEECGAIVGPMGHSKTTCLKLIEEIKQFEAHKNAVLSSGALYRLQPTDFELRDTSDPIVGKPTGEAKFEYIADVSDVGKTTGEAKMEDVYIADVSDAKMRVGQPGNFLGVILKMFEGRATPWSQYLNRVALAITPHAKDILVVPAADQGFADRAGLPTDNEVYYVVFVTPEVVRIAVRARKYLAAEELAAVCTHISIDVLKCPGLHVRLQ